MVNRILRESGDFDLYKACIQINDNWNLNQMGESLDRYPNSKVIKYLRFGWQLNTEFTAINWDNPPNQKGAHKNVKQVRAYLKKEIVNGSVIRLFIQNPFGKSARFSPLDTRWKRVRSVEGYS